MNMKKPSAKTILSESSSKKGRPLVIWISLLLLSVFLIAVLSGAWVDYYLLKKNHLLIAFYLRIFSRLLISAFLFFTIMCIVTGSKKYPLLLKVFYVLIFVGQLFFYFYSLSNDSIEDLGEHFGFFIMMAFTVLIYINFTRFMHKNEKRV